MSADADLIITNARIFTSDPENLYAEAVAVHGNRIVFVGSNEDAKSWQGKSTRIIDAQGRTLMPGYIDSHFHLLWGALWLGNAQIREVNNLDELKNILLAFADENKTMSWIVGRGIKYGVVSMRHELDTIISDRPVYVRAFDGHTVWSHCLGKH